MKEELSMKIKSIVLTAALATAFSAFSGSVDVDWFTTNVTSVVGTFDTAVSAPVVVTNSVPVPEGWTISSCAITAHVTNLVLFASTPTATELSGAKGAICATHDSTANTNKWYGLNATPEWVVLTPSVAPVEGGDYKFRMEFGASTVTYKVSTISGDTPVATSDALTRSGDANFVTNLCAFAGMGGCTNIVGEIVIAVADTTAVSVDGGSVLVPTSMDNPTSTDTPNKLAKWVNYVLGIDGSDAAAKPYVATVQNNNPNTLTVKLGGVNVLNQNQTGAKVTYTIQAGDTPNGSSWGPVVGEEYEYKDSGASFEIGTPSDVKYYRIKIKIDLAH